MERHGREGEAMPGLLRLGSSRALGAGFFPPIPTVADDTLNGSRCSSLRKAASLKRDFNSLQLKTGRLSSSILSAFTMLQRVR